MSIVGACANRGKQPAIHFAIVVIVKYFFRSSSHLKVLLNTMVKAKSFSSTSRGVTKSMRAKGTSENTQKRAKEDDEAAARIYKNYAQSNIGDDSETELEIAGDADRHHAMFSEGASGGPYIRNRPKYGGREDSVGDAGSPHGEEEKCTPSGDLSKLLNLEAEQYRRIMKKQRDHRCALCPFREFPRPCKVLAHVSNYHVASNNWVASGRKQLRVCIALYDNDVLCEGDDFTPMPNYLRRSADIIRGQISKNSPEAVVDLGANNLIDRDIRLIQFAFGPEFRHVGYIRQNENSFRTLGYNIYSEAFYNQVFRSALSHQGRIDRIQSQMDDICANELGSLQPKFIHVWEAVLFDIFYSPGVEERLATMLEICRANGEFESITVDCTVKPTLPLLGQVNRNILKSKKKNQAVPYAEQYHSVLIVRGACGSALLVEPMFSENILASAAVYLKKFTEGQRGSVKFMSTDKTSGLLVATMRQVFPGLIGCALDPVHLAMAVEQPTWEKRNRISRCLRSIMSKFTPTIYGKAASGAFYDGSDIRRTLEEDRIKKEFSGGCNVGQDYAISRLKCISPDRGFDKRSEFMMLLRYLVAAHPDLARKKGRTSKSISQLLRSSCDEGTVEWYLNNERMRRMVSPKIAPFIAVGTTGSEAINAELKLWFRGIFQIHGPILELKLRIFQIAKLSAFVSAMYNKTTHQIKQQRVLARCIKKRRLFSTEEEWRAWCEEQNASGSKSRSNFMKKRDEYAARLASWKKKNGKKEGAKHVKKALKRTPYRQYKGSRDRWIGGAQVPQK